jgi:hypothetical protein
VLDRSRKRYDLAYFVELALEIEAAGAHVLAIKDMTGLLEPEAARLLVGAARTRSRACASSRAPRPVRPSAGRTARSSSRRTGARARHAATDRASSHSSRMAARNRLALATIPNTWAPRMWDRLVAKGVDRRGQTEGRERRKRRRT